MQTLEQVAQILIQAVEVSRAETKRVFTKEKNERRLRAYYNACRTVTVRGGFPVLVWMEICPEEKDVGYMNEYVADYEFSTLNYSPVSFLKLTAKEECNLLNDAFDQYLCSL